MTTLHKIALPALVAAMLIGWSPQPLAAQDGAPPAVRSDLTLPTPPPTADVGGTSPVLPADAAPATTAPPGAAMLHDMSPWGMFLAAHIVVKAVMVSLAFACFITWTVFAFKLVEIAWSRARARHSASVIRDAQTLTAATTALQKRRDPAAFMAQVALAEYHRSDSALAAAGPEGLKERTRSVLERVEMQAASRMRRGTGLLATIGSTAPFVGLFGTVWGIMNAFVGIAESHTTNLAVVAPGIAEALLATAIGLVAAIPAVMTYNHFARGIAGYRLILGDAGAGVERLLSRDLDFRKAGRTEV